MKRIILMLGILLLMMSLPAAARSVTVTGMGVTASQAENEALRMAVEKSVGVLVDSQTLVDKSIVIRDNIYTQARGFIRDYTVKQRTQTSSGWQVTIDAVVDDQPNSALMTELARLGIIDVALRNPRIAVCIPEAHISHNIPDPAGETALVKALVEAGFSNVVAVDIPSGNPYNMSAVALRQAAREFGVDIMIVGEAFSESAGDPAQYLPGKQSTRLQACRARVEAKMFIAKTGQIIAADGKYGSGVDNLENIAAKKALAKAGKQMGEYFVGQITGMYTNRQDVKIVAYGADFSKINQVQTAAGAVHGVRGVNLATYSGGKAIFNVMYSGSPQTLWNELQRASSADLELVEISYNTVTIRVR